MGNRPISIIGTSWDNANRNAMEQNRKDTKQGLDELAAKDTQLEGSISTAQTAANSAMNKANAAQTKADSVQEQVNDLVVASGNSNAEVIQARTDVNGVTSTTLKDRLDKQQKKMKKFCTPEEYGAVGDGVTNDTEALRQAFTSGKYVLLDAVTYLVEIPLLNQYFAIEANGLCRGAEGVKGQTVIKLKLDNTVDPLTNGKSGILVAWGCNVKNIIFDGGFDYTKTTSDLSSIVTMGGNSVIHDCAFKNSKGSNLGITGSNVKAFNNIYDSFGDHAVYIHQETTGTRIYDIHVYDSVMTENDSYQNGTQGGKIRGTIKIRDNVERVFIHGNTVFGDQCLLVSGKALSPNGIPKKIHSYNNHYYTTYSGIHLDTELGTDNGHRITREDVYSSNDHIYLMADNSIGVALENAQITIVDYEIVSLSDANTATSGMSNFNTGDTGPSYVKGGKLKGVRIGLFSLGTDTLIEDNDFIDILASGGCAIYSKYPDRVINNRGFNCLEGLRVVGTNTTKKAIYDNNSWFACGTGVTVKTGAKGYHLTNQKFYGCTTASIAIENGIEFRTEVSYGNTVISGPELPDAGANGSVVVHTPYISKARVSTSLPGAIKEFYGNEIIVNDGVNGDKLYKCLKNSSGGYYWKEL
jgi:hypothetical protein